MLPDNPEFSLIKKIAFLVIFILLIFGGLFGTKFWQIDQAKQSRKAPPPASVLVTPVKQEYWQDTLPAIGSLQPVSGINISNEFAGIVSAIHFKSGQLIKKNDLLIELDTTTDQAELDGLLASRKLAQLKFDRQVRLLASKATSKSSHDEARALLDEAKAAVIAKKSILNKKRIRAPFNGLIGIRQVDMGQYIDKGYNIAPLQSLSPIYADFTLPERNFSHLKVQQRVSVKVQAYPNEVFNGVITAINPGFNSETRTISIRATVDNAEHKLRAGMFTEIEVYTSTAQPVLTLPTNSITFNTYGNNVFVVTEKEGHHTVHQQTIEIGKQKSNRVEITKGLKLGDIVVNEGQVKLRNGMSVHATKAETTDVSKGKTP